MSEAAEVWCIEDPNEEWYNPMKWRKGTWMPEGKVILELFERLKKEKILELKWKCPGRRPPVSDRPEEEMETTENLDDDQEEEEKQDEKPTSFGEFDFDDAPSEASTKITPRRTPGTGKSPRPQKRVARMDNILNDIMRQRKQNQAARANKTLGIKARRSPIYSNAASPKGRPGLTSCPGSSALMPLTTDSFSARTFSTATSNPTSTMPASTAAPMETDQYDSKAPAPVPVHSTAVMSTSVAPPPLVSTPGLKSPPFTPTPSQTRESQTNVTPVNPGSTPSSAAFNPVTTTVGSVKAKLQSQFTPPPVSQADQSRTKTPPSSHSGPSAPQTVPKLLLKIPPSNHANQHPFISNKSEQLGYSAVRKTSPPVSQTGQRTPPVSQNAPKTPPVYPKSPKTPPGHHSFVQNPPKTFVAHQNTPKTPPVNQNAPKTPPVYQNTPKTPPSYQNAPKTPPVYQNAPRTPPVYQNAPKTPPVYQYAPKTPPVYQNSPKTPPVYQTPPKTPPVYQNAPKTPPVYQNSPKTPPVYQNPPKTPPVYQNPKTPPVYQNAPKTPPGYQNVLKTPPVYQHAPKTPPAYQNAPRTPPVSQAGIMTPPSFQNAPKTPPVYQNAMSMSPPYHGGPKTPSFQKAPSAHQNAPKTLPLYQNNPRFPTATYQNTSKTPPPYHTVMSRGPPVSTGSPSPMVRMTYSDPGGIRNPMTPGQFMGNIPGLRQMMGQIPRTAPPGMRPPMAHTAAVSVAPGMPVENLNLSPSMMNALARSVNAGIQGVRPLTSSPSGPGMLVANTSPTMSSHDPHPIPLGHPSGKTQPSGISYKTP